MFIYNGWQLYKILIMIKYFIIRNVVRDNNKAVIINDVCNIW